MEYINPGLLQTPRILSHSDISKCILEVGPLHKVGAVCCATGSKSIANKIFCKSSMVGSQICRCSRSVLHCSCFFVRRAGCACYVDRAFSLMGHILTHDRLHTGIEMITHMHHLLHLAIMYVNNTDKKWKRLEKELWIVCIVLAVCRWLGTHWGEIGQGVWGPMCFWTRHPPPHQWLQHSNFFMGTVGDCIQDVTSFLHLRCCFLLGSRLDTTHSNSNGNPQQLSCPLCTCAHRIISCLPHLVSWAVQMQCQSLGELSEIPGSSLPGLTTS